MAKERVIIQESLAFDDVLLEPSYTEVTPKDVDLRTRLTRKISLNIPLISSAMDTVTESAMSISLAREGGIGIIHKNMTLEKQAHEVRKVKKSESGMINDPITTEPETKIGQVLEIMEEYRISGVPVVKKGRLVGIVTNRDLRFESDLEKPVEKVMTKENLITVSEGINLKEAKKLLHRHKIEKLLVVSNKDKLAGLITIKDIEKVKKYPNACKDELGRLRVGAAIGVIGTDWKKRTKELIKEGVDVVVIDTAHGHSKAVINTAKSFKNDFPEVQLIAGNVATEEGAKSLIAAGVDGVKVGIGPGSICTTRIVAGIGVPQFSAIMRCDQGAENSGVPLIADGGIKFSGDITKAIAAGAHSVMIGGLFAGMEESPGEMVFYQGRSYKAYRGMGSIEAMAKGSKDRYAQFDVTDKKAFVPEGVVARVPYRGDLAGNLRQLVGGLRSGMGYVGCKNIEELRNFNRFLQITNAGLKESHVHDVIITKGAPNYMFD